MSGRKTTAKLRLFLLGTLDLAPGGLNRTPAGNLVIPKYTRADPKNPTANPKTQQTHPKTQPWRSRGAQRPGPQATDASQQILHGRSILSAFPRGKKKKTHQKRTPERTIQKKFNTTESIKTSKNTLSLNFPSGIPHRSSRRNEPPIPRQSRPLSRWPRDPSVPCTRPARRPGVPWFWTCRRPAGCPAAPW